MFENDKLHGPNTSTTSHQLGSNACEALVVLCGAHTLASYLYIHSTHAQTRGRSQSRSSSLCS